MKKQKFEYTFIYMPSHPKASSNGCVYEHVLVAEQKLGRPLTKDEVVHHIDGNKKNNNPDNLMIFATDSDHIGYHNGRKAYEQDGVWHTIKPSYTCEQCGKIFERNFTSKGKHVYCSAECAYLSRTQCFPSKKELVDTLIDYNGNFWQAAKQFGITDNALRKKCKAYGLPIHSIDYKLPF